MRPCQAGLIGLALIVLSGPAAGQTRFSWPDTTVDVGAYTAIEECDAAVQRSHDTVRARRLQVSGIWSDTLAYTPGEARVSIPAQVVATARACMVHFANADSVPIEDFRFVMPLYLVAGWTDRARTLADRRMAVVAPDADKELIAVLDSVVEFYFGRGAGMISMPPQLDLAEEVVSTYVSRIRDRIDRLKIYFRLVTQAFSGGAIDTAAVVRFGTQVAAYMDSLTAEERMLLEEEFSALGIEDFTRRYYDVLGWTLGRQMFLDSLRSSTEAYVKVKRDAWVRATGQPPELVGFGMPLGEKAPPLQGGRLHGRPDGTVPRPLPGRVSLVVFIDRASCDPSARLEMEDYMYAPKCTGMLSVLRRLEERFPALDVTVVAQTAGHFGYIKESVTPEREGELTKRWLEGFGLRSAVFMVETPYWRLPAPDSRRVAPEPPEIVKMYTFGKSWQILPGSAFLIDQDGIIIHAGNLYRNEERDFADMIEVLLEREGQR